MKLPQFSWVHASISDRPALQLLAFAMLAILVAASLTSCSEDSHEFSGAVSDPPPVIQDFVLTDQHGDEFRMSTDSGDVSVIFFGYTLCPDVCPTTLADMVKAKRILEADADEVSFIWITVDPERDSPEVLGQRIAVFDPEFIGLSGTREILEEVWDDFGIVVERDDTQGSAAGYLVSHTANTYLVDRNMKNLVVFTFGTASDDIAADVAAVLKDQKEQ
ncbi:MAG: SCO family protein [Chloroflexi bacterium]|nr:SCO family protein [Chloroflexota bacterium]